MLGGSAFGEPRSARVVSRKQSRSAYLRTLRFYRRRKVREQLRHARRVMSLVKARKATVIAVVGGAVLALLALGGTLGAFAAHHWWHG